MDEGYLRQRRNLFSVSIFILLAVWGGSYQNTLFPIRLERPFVAELFMWLGFAYFWYRTSLYQPPTLSQLLFNEKSLFVIKKHDLNFYNIHGLGSCNGKITLKPNPNNSDQTRFTLQGFSYLKNDSVTDTTNINIKKNDTFTSINPIKFYLESKLSQTIFFLTLLHLSY